MIDTRIIGPIYCFHIFLVYSLLLGFKFEPILAQILENLTNFYCGSDFANCTNFMWSKTSLEEGPISQKLQKFKHHDFIFKVSTPPPA